MEAQLNITCRGENGDLPDPVNYDMTDQEIRQMASEAVATGYVPGITAQVVDFSDFIVEHYPAEGDLPARLMLRPKTPFGA